jgi:hypothetical protein
LWVQILLFDDCENLAVSIYKLNNKKLMDSLKDAGISVMQKLILNFANYCFSEGISEHRALT